MTKTEPVNATADTKPALLHGLPDGGTMYAFVVGLETYRPGAGGLDAVDFARNDAEAFAQVLREIYPPDRTEIEVLLDEAATANDLKYLLGSRIKGLGPDDLFIFYYAGHGFHGAGGNRISAWDSHAHHVDQTTLLLNDILIEPFAESACDRALAFIDACASDFAPTVASRDVLSDLDVREFDAFLQSADYAAVYLSSSPGQQSWPAREFKHGAWTYFLLRALRGEDDRALRNRVLTDVSLRDYLKREVPQYLTKRTEIRATQIPQARIEASNTFLIRAVPVAPRPVPVARDLSRAGVRSSRQYFEAIGSGDVSSLKGFVKGAHYVSKVATTAAESFVKGLLSETIDAELQEVYEAAKETLGYRARQVSVMSADAQGNVDTPAFRYWIESRLKKDDPSQYSIARRLEIRDEGEARLEEIDAIFGTRFGKIVVQVEGFGVDFDDLVDFLEDVREAHGGKVKDESLKERVTYTSPDNTEIRFDFAQRRVKFSVNGRNPVSQVLDVARSYRFGLPARGQLLLG